MAFLNSETLVKQLIFLVVAFAMTACAHVYKKPYELAHGTGTWERAKSCPPGGQPCTCDRTPANPPSSLFRTRLDNDPCSEQALQLERAYYPSIIRGTAYRSGDNAPPLLGVALSGGGARSASTSIGFLHALDHKGILAQVDLISSVSGGSYASYWFFSHLYNANATDELRRCDLRLRIASDGNPEDEIIRKFKMEFESKKKECAVLIVRATSNSEKWTIAGFDDAGQFHTVVIDDPSHKLSEELKKNPINKSRIVELATSSLGRTHSEELRVLRDETKNEDRYNKLFDSDDRFQHQVAKNSRLATKWQDPIRSWFEMTGEVLTWLPMIPYHWLTAGLFDRKENRNPLTHYYHAGLERAYGLYPLDNENPPTSFANDSDLQVLDNPIPVIPRYEAYDPSIEDIEAFHKAQRQNPALMPPFWIINATAVYGGKAKMFREQSWSGFSHDLRDTVYEFTPIHYGSPRFGYCQYPKHRQEGSPNDDAYRGCNSVDTSLLKYSRLVGASGAAVDGISPMANVLLDVVNAAIGRYIDNPRVDDSVRQTHEWLPFPFYGLHRAQHDEASPKIYLTDGGHAENLGLYALIKRKVKNIIVLDAEQEYESFEDAEQEYEPFERVSVRHMAAAFESLQELRCRLYAEHGLHLMISKYENGKDSVSEPFFPDAGPCETASREHLEGCALRIMSVSDDSDKTQLISQFRAEFESKKDVCAVLIVAISTNAAKEWIVAGYNDAGEFKTVLISDTNDELAKELKKAEGANRNKLITLATSNLGRTHLEFTVQEEPFPYFLGWICLNGRRNCANDADLLNILYVKLAIGKDRAKFKSEDRGDWKAECSTDKRYQCNVREYFHDHQEIFPHESTADIFYSDDQYTAYRDLGFDLAKCIKFDDKVKKLSVDRTYAECR